MKILRVQAFPKIFEISTKAIAEFLKTFFHIN